MLSLAACDNGAVIRDSGGNAVDRSTEELYVELEDGRTVHCLIIGRGHGGPSCDWENAR